MKKLFINFLKKHFYKFFLGDKLSSSVQMQQVRLMNQYVKDLKNNNLPEFDTIGFKVFSQFEEDGKLLFIFSILGMGSKTFVDIGSHDCVNSNCANLAVHFNWKGLFVDGDKKNIEIGKNFYKKIPNAWSYKPKFSISFVTPKNINEIIKSNGFEGEIELLSIDIDGNDYWVWKAIEVIQPKVVIVESQVAFGLKNVVVPYQEEYNFDVENNYYCGASTFALNKLANQKGYRLVGSNEYGNNLFFVKNGLAENELPEISIETTLKHPFSTEKFSYFDGFKDKEFVEV